MLSNDDMPEPKVAAGTSSGELQQPSPVAEDKGHSANGFADVPLAGLLSRYVSVWLWSIILGSRLDQTQKAMMVTKATADRKFAASLS